MGFDEFERRRLAARKAMALLQKGATGKGDDGDKPKSRQILKSDDKIGQVLENRIQDVVDQGQPIDQRAVDQKTADDARKRENRRFKDSSEPKSKDKSFAAVRKKKRKKKE